MAKPVQLRHAEIGDLDALTLLEKRCFDYDVMSRRNFRRQLVNKHNIIVVAEMAEGVIGYVLVFLRKRSTCARLYSLAVDPEWRGQGISRLLLDKAEATLKTMDKAALRLEVAEDNVSAQSLYITSGYRQPRIRSNYYDNGKAAILYAKEFTPC